jgi:fatty-acyl-CoA synthase
MIPNLPAQAEAHFGVPACGAVLNTINTRLDVGTVSYILDHGGARLVLADTQFIELAEAAIAALDGEKPQLIEVADPQAGYPATGRHPEYEDLLQEGHADFRWMMPVLGGTVVCCRDISAKAIYDAIADKGVTHFGGAPIVLNLIVNAKAEDRRTFDHQVEVFTAGAPPAPATLASIETLGFNVTQVYGLTETYGHITECLWDETWDALPQAEKAIIKAHQGVAMPMMEDVTVLDENMQQVPMDGTTQGEIMIRGNPVMKGYFKNPKATLKELSGDYFHSGDLAVQHPNGYIQIADRAKDIIISGGENISSVEVEGVLMAHPAVSLCAVVAKPDDKWGEVPCAFVELKDDVTVTHDALIAHARSSLAGFKTPKTIIFQELPKTATGKIQKFELRTFAKTL